VLLVLLVLEWISHPHRPPRFLRRLAQGAGDQWDPRAWAREMADPLDQLLGLSLLRWHGGNPSEHRDAVDPEKRPEPPHKKGE